MNNSAIYKTMNIIATLILIATTLILAFNWPQIPDQVPTHFGLNGEADAYGGKFMLIFFDLLAWGLLVGMSILVKYPDKWNYPVKVTEENKTRLYALGRAMLEITKLFITILFALIIIGISLSTEIPQVLVIILVAALLIISFGFIYLMKKCA